MKLLTQTIINQLARNGEVADKDPNFDPSPVVKLFTPWAGATWLLGWTEPQIVIRFWIVAVMLALIGLATLKLR